MGLELPAIHNYTFEDIENLIGGDNTRAQVIIDCARADGRFNVYVYQGATAALSNISDEHGYYYIAADGSGFDSGWFSPDQYGEMKLQLNGGRKRSAIDFMLGRDAY